MKIGQDSRTVVETRIAETRGNGKNGLSFGEAVATQQKKLQSEQLGTLFKDVEKQGERLIRSQTLKDFTQYKQLVQRFVKEAVSIGMNLKQHKGWNSQGRLQTSRLVQEIDTKLLEMTDTMIKKEEKSISLLDQIGEMKGLLINLYM
ncbi:YaaR family protein [Fictibacillus enclensis]|uniref:YaaR family protein n=1 Tax=Fictibacillus enclensis TaxID=1017270 RepID=UPI0025A22A25|nr:YaaR family protein [Fictibacillus enclensis]MDM5335939.1 YaaR family protein [Fictibacillus enclensis]